MNDREMISAAAKILSKADILIGEGCMLEEHWTPFYKPNILIKCSLQIAGDGFTGYGPPKETYNFFGGVKVRISTWSCVEEHFCQICENNKFILKIAM